MDKQLSFEESATISHQSEHIAISDDTVKRRATIKDYFRLIKPGIIYSNSLATLAGFWVASGWDINWILLFYTLIGTAFVMASGTVINNYLDRDMDAKMERTAKRALPSGLMTPATVMTFGIILGVIGIAILAFGTTHVAALLGVLGFVLYVGLYTAWFKRTSVWSTFVGAFSGAVPPVIGFCAVETTDAIGALILFGFMFLWQPPHFWALGIRRREDYAAAGFPLLPVVKGVEVTKHAMMRYVVLLVPVSILLSVFGYVGKIYLIGATVLGLIWVYQCFKGFSTKDDMKWAKGNFMFSINYLMILLILMIIDTVHKGS
ncbi:heme o synthase [Paenibacillus sp. N1-5-1-14]|uniref:heme o synthase n=1 Tax=Paenibacillus radicibacter TaxID=2972488 RepID=UPI002158D738|nr:heme o synthase [Paenibacillus radicibacter]MCR8645307.1 heme o synthase [Paenibacillus radicibacter]